MGESSQSFKLSVGDERDVRALRDQALGIFVSASHSVGRGWPRVNSFEHLVLAQTVDFHLYTPSGREHFTPNGHLPQVGERWKKPQLSINLLGDGLRDALDPKLRV